MVENESKGCGRGCMGCLLKLFIANAVVVGIGFAVVTYVAYMDAKEKREAALRETTRINRKIQEHRRAYDTLRETERFDFLAPYAQREGWKQDITEAERIATGAVRALEAEEAPPLEQLPVILKRARSALAMSDKVNQRMARLETVRDQAPEMVEAAEEQVPETEAILTGLDRYVAEAKEDFPEKSKKIERVRNQYAPTERVVEGGRRIVAGAQAELAKRGTGKFVDYDRLDRNLQLVAENLAKAKEADAAVRGKVGKLYESYTKILSDMRADHYITVGRSTWDNDMDYSHEHIFTFPPQPVSSETYTYYANLKPDTTLARYDYLSGAYRVLPQIDAAMWNALKIDADQGIPAADDTGVYWLEDGPVKTFHRYTVIRNGDPEESDWEPVDEETYEELYDYLGMEIASKPYGVFEEERLESPAPPGMGYVGHPRYGRWRTDPATGEEYWDFDDEYDPFFELDIDIGKKGKRRRYTRNEWQSWNREYRGKEPYYGSTDDEEQRFGTAGVFVRNSPRYRNSAFAKRGGLAAAAASFRGAGASRRGRGPGGLGK